MVEIDEIKDFLKQGYTYDQLEEWLKQQKIGFMKRRSLLNKGVLRFNADNKKLLVQHKQEEKNKTKEQIAITLDQKKFIKKQQNTFGQDITLDLNNLQEPTQGYSPQTKKGFWDFQAKKQAKLEAKYPDKTVLVRIELNNGFYKNFIVVEQNGGFSYREKFYIFDNLNKTFDIDANLWCYEFSENYSIPIKSKLVNVDGQKVMRIIPINLPLDKKIPIIKIREALQEAGLSEIEYASNPSIMYWFTHSRIAEKILMGVDEDAFFRFMKLMIIIILLIVVINFLLGLYGTGMFDSMLGSG